MELTPKVLIASRSKELRQKIFENLIPFKFNISSIENFQSVAKDDLLNNYHLAIINIESKVELEAISQICPRKKTTKVILISSLNKINFDLYNINCSLASDFNEVDLILKTNELLCNLNIQRKIKNINKQILSRRKTRKKSVPISANNFLKTQIKKAGEYALGKKHIFISGPAGSGKSRFVDYIFNNSPIEEKNYLYINCQTFSEEDIETLLFETHNGVKYYTDYLNPKFKGIVYLDHITRLNLQTQSRLAKRIKELVTDETINRNIQFVATSTFKCQTAIDEFLLLPSLSRLICEAQIVITPLNQRREDILYLFDHFITEFSNDLNQEVPKVSTALNNFLADYNWPGNVKQLKQVAKKYCYLGHKLPLGKFKKIILKPATDVSKPSDNLSFRQSSNQYRPEFLRKNLE